MAFTLIRPLASSTIGGRFKELYTNSLGERYEHPGVDLLTPAGLGSPVLACAAGRVTIHKPGDGWGDGSFGVCCVIDHPDTPYWTIVAHMIDEALPFDDGDVVQQGQRVGRMGVTGTTTGPHVHWALQQGGGGGFAPARFKDAAGILRIGNPGLLDPLLYVGTAPAPPAPKTIEERLAVLETDSALHLKTLGGIAAYEYDYLVSIQNMQEALNDIYAVLNMNARNILATLQQEP